LVFLMSMVVA